MKWHSPDATVWFAGLIISTCEVSSEVETGDLLVEEVVPSVEDVILDLLHLAATGQVLHEDEAPAVDRPLHHLGDANAAL